MATAVLAGSTGFVGSHILSHLLNNPNFSTIYAYTRRDLPSHPTTNKTLIPLPSSTPVKEWPTQFPTPPIATPKIFISSLGTTRAAAGGLEAQRTIDVDLNYSLAKAAKDAGIETYVLVSSANANAKSSLAYPAMKGELEDLVKGLGFKYTVILRPGLIMGKREESRPAEAVIRGVAGWMKWVSPKLTNFWGQEADTIARAAIKAGVQCLEGKRAEGVWEIEQKEIIELDAE